MTKAASATRPPVDPARAIALALTVASGKPHSDRCDEVRLVLLSIRLSGWEIVAKEKK